MLNLSEISVGIFKYKVLGKKLRTNDKHCDIQNLGLAV